MNDEVEKSKELTSRLMQLFDEYHPTVVANVACALAVDVAAKMCKNGLPALAGRYAKWVNRHMLTVIEETEPETLDR